MVGRMHQQSANRRWQILPPNAANRLRIVVDKRQHAKPSIVQSRLQLQSQSIRRSRLTLASQRPQLFFAQLPSFGIAQQPIHAAHDVPHLPAYRRQTHLLTVDFLVIQVCSPSLGVFRSQLQCMYHSARHCGNLGIRPAQPRLN